MFYYNLTFSDNGLYLTTQVNKVNITIGEEVMPGILGVPAEGTRSLRKKKGSKNFMKICGNLNDMNIKKVNKKALKREYQLLFELVSKALFPRSKKRTIVIGTDLFLTEVLSKYQKVNLPTAMIEHMHTIVMIKDGKHGLAYGF